MLLLSSLQSILQLIIFYLHSVYHRFFWLVDLKHFSIKLFSKFFEAPDHTSRSYFGEVDFCQLRIVCFVFFDVLFSASCMNSDDGPFSFTIMVNQWSSTLSLFGRDSMQNIASFFHHIKNIISLCESILFCFVYYSILSFESRFGISKKRKNRFFILSYRVSIQFKKFLFLDVLL